MPSGQGVHVDVCWWMKEPGSQTVGPEARGVMKSEINRANFLYTGY